MAFQHQAVKKRRQYFEVDPRQIQVAEGWNPRSDFGGEDDEELKRSIIECGVLLPLYIRKRDSNIELIDGERRLRAALIAIEEGHDIQTVPCFLARRNISDIEAMIIALNADTGKPLQPVEEGRAFCKLKGWGVQVKDIAQRTGKSPTYVRERVALVDASPELEKAINDGSVPLKDARTIIKESGGSIEKQDQKTEAASQPKPKLEKMAVVYSKSKFMMKRPGREVDEVFIREMLTMPFLEKLKDGGYDLTTIKFEVKRAAENVD